MATIELQQCGTVFSVQSVLRCYKQHKLEAAISQSVEWSQLVSDLVSRELLQLRPRTVREPRVRGTSAI
jgi:hypothetical protein